VNVFAIADPLALEMELSAGERSARDAAATIVDQAVLPIIADAFEAGRFPRELVPAIAGAGLLGGTLTGYGCAGLSHTANGLAIAELERGDSGVRSFASVQSSLVMWPIFTYGSPEQKERWLPGMARGELVGCFGLTEPLSGSDPGSMRTHARRDGDDWILEGQKLWLTNGPFADVALIWAKTEGDAADSIRGFLVESNRPGFAMSEVPRKMSLRASASGALTLDSVRVHKDAMLPSVRGLKGPLTCLNQARYGIAWGAIGAHAACFESARDYAKSRVQFGEPIGARQLVQAKLADMYTALGHAQLLALRLGRLKDQGKLTSVQISLGKRANVAAALDAARSARDVLGGIGITLAHPPIRHMLNLETVRTYEGTHDVHTLVLGREITGLDAFS
jgi:glutaryl-CoA dehydrogenase